LVIYAAAIAARSNRDVGDVMTAVTRIAFGCASDIPVITNAGNHPVIVAAAGRDAIAVSVVANAAVNVAAQCHCQCCCAAVNKLKDLVAALNLFKKPRRRFIFHRVNKRQVHSFPVKSVLHL
jgi:hypothetical protein